MLAGDDRTVHEHPSATLDDGGGSRCERGGVRFERVDDENFTAPELADLLGGSSDSCDASPHAGSSRLPEKLPRRHARLGDERFRAVRVDGGRVETDERGLRSRERIRHADVAALARPALNDLSQGAPRFLLERSEVQIVVVAQSPRVSPQGQHPRSVLPLLGTDDVEEPRLELGARLNRRRGGRFDTDLGEQAGVLRVLGRGSDEQTDELEGVSRPDVIVVVAAEDARSVSEAG